MSKLTDQIYAHSPVWLQQLGINVYGYFWARRRLGPLFESMTKQYVDREQWSSEQFHEYVEAQLRGQVQRAYHEVPFYQKWYREHGITDDFIQRFEMHDLGKLPMLDKAAVRSDPSSLLTERAAKNPPPTFSTSGTTGTPIKVYCDSATHQHNLAAREARSFRWAGASIREPRSSIGGRLVVPRANSHPPFWRYNVWEKQLYLSAFHISPANLVDYVAGLNRFKPVTMTGYTAAHVSLGRLILKENVQVHAPRAIIAESERLEPQMRQVLETAFKTRVFEEYGSTENCALATECEHGRLHFHPDFGYVEILMPDGRPAPPGETGELVLTGFANTNQIFIRYRIGDLATWSDRPCPCGRAALPVVSEILGRQEDVIISPDGRALWGFFRVFYALPGVAEGQIIQHALDKIEVKVVPTHEYSDTDEKEIRGRVRTRVGPDVTVKVLRVTEIPRGKNGKFRAVISHVSTSPGAPESFADGH